MNNIKVEIVADSINKQSDRITSMVLTYPRIIHAEIMTHRLFSRNAASSRAVPVKRMIDSVRNNMFTPFAVQKTHKGMQGSEYFLGEEFEQAKNLWVEAGEFALNQAEKMDKFGITKQLINRILEPYQYYQTLITATEWENFFSLRCPQYQLYPHSPSFKSRKDMEKYYEDAGGMQPMTDLEWLKFNSGQAEIHMMALAEAMWDARNESTPKLLEPGEWHIPYGDKIEEGIEQLKGLRYPSDEDPPEIYDGDSCISGVAIGVSTGMCARVSYTTVGDEKEVKYETLIGIHDKMLKADPFHASPFEHCSQAMTDEEYERFIKVVPSKKQKVSLDGHTLSHTEEEYGWCRNYRGYKQYRHIIEN